MSEKKREAIRELAREALFERYWPRRMRVPNAPAFDPRGNQTWWTDALVDAIRHTDALDVLVHELGEYQSDDPKFAITWGNGWEMTQHAFLSIGVSQHAVCVSPAPDEAGYWVFEDDRESKRQVPWPSDDARDLVLAASRYERARHPETWVWESDE